jgi:enamine deaminase RidA (YjgF/YER057c/UK114 family)
MSEKDRTDWRPRGVPIPGVAKTTGGFQPVVRAGPLVFISGQVSQDADGALVGENDIRAQSRQVYANLRRAVEGAGGSVSNIVQLTTFTLDRDHRPAIREEREKAFGGWQPTSTLVVISGLAKPEYLLEVEAIAVIPEQPDPRQPSQ